MSEKKFLDKSGITYLWKKIESDRTNYVTNYVTSQNFATQDSLAAVVEAVDEIKLDVYDFITNTEIDQICV